MPVEVILPKVDMDMETGQISRWYAKDGDTVTKGQVLFEIETDKAAMEIDAPASGTLRDVSAQEGAVVPVGDAVAWIFEEGEAYQPQSATPAPAPAPAPAAPVLEDVTSNAAPLASATPVTATQADAGTAIRATPLARRLAQNSGINLADISGSGPKGRITRKDVEAHQPVAIIQPETIAPAPDKPVCKPKPQPVLTGSASDLLNAVWLRQGKAGVLPLVLIHGYGSDLNNWRPMLASASADQPVLAIDLPGHGSSYRNAPDTLDDLAETVEQTLNAHNIGAYVLAGHSFGSAVAATLAERAQTDIRALALVSPAGLGPKINGDFLTGFNQAKSEASLLPWLRLLVADDAVLTRPFINATLAQAADTSLRHAQQLYIDRFFADGTQLFTIRALLDKLTIPTRIITGLADKIIPASQTSGLKGEIAVHLFANTGHMPQLERRTEVMRILHEMVKVAT